MNIHASALEGGNPLPRKYVVTDTTLTTQLSLTTVMKDWNVAPAVADDRFAFVPPKGTKPITFMRLDKSSGSGR